MAFARFLELSAARGIDAQRFDPGEIKNKPIST